MVDCKEILEIIKSPDRENLNIELKKSDIIYTKEGKKKLAHQIVAFANRLGGKILIGILDDGNFEGKFPDRSNPGWKAPCF